MPTCWNPGSLVVFARDPMTGNLTHVQTIGKLPELLGATGLCCPRTVGSPSRPLSSRRRSSCFVATRNPGQTDAARRGRSQRPGPRVPERGRVLAGWEIRVHRRRRRQTRHSGVRVYKLAGEKLIDAGMDLGRNRCYSGARGLAFHPRRQSLVRRMLPARTPWWSPISIPTPARSRSARSSGRPAKAAPPSPTPTSARSPESQGLIDVVSSPDGRFVTTCSGRFGGTTAVTSFKFGDDGHLAFASGTKSSVQNSSVETSLPSPRMDREFTPQEPSRESSPRGPRPEKRKSLAQRRHFRRRPAGRSRQDQEPRGRHHQLRRPVRLCRDRRQERHLHIPA